MITILLLISLTALVNFIGVLGPELSFDALWYHLTLPKIYLLEKTIRFVPGGLLYYSAMPRLGEMFYTLALLLADERLAKFIHFSFGLLAALFTYKISRLFLNKKFSAVAALIFYSTLVVGWLSTTAYIDLIRTAFEAGSLLFFLQWWKGDWGDKGNKGEINDLCLAGLFLGLAVSVKLLALGSIVIFILLIFLKKNFLNPHSPRRSQSRCFATFEVFLATFSFMLCTFIPVLPWFYFAHRDTGNPIYPLGAGILDTSHRIPDFSLIKFFSDFWNLILKPQDPLSPIFLIILPFLVIGVIRKIGGKRKQQFGFGRPIFCLMAYSFLSYLVWYFTPRTGGGRFILPYLPTWSVLTAYLISIQKRKIKSFLVIIVFITAFTHLGFRFMANEKYLPFILGLQTKQEFLCQNLEFETNVFYDCDGFFQKTIKPTDKVLIYGSHNLYYVNFHFIHESWRGKNAWFNYVLTQNCPLPLKFAKLPLIYQNKQTGVRLYQMK